MFSWDDFDTRTTKIICDSCHKEITDAAKRYLNRVGVPRRQNKYWLLRRQFKINLLGFSFVIMQFHNS